MSHKLAETINGTLSLNFNSHTAIIEGKQLNALYNALLLQSVQFIQVTTGHDIPEGTPDIYRFVGRKSATS